MSSFDDTLAEMLAEMERKFGQRQRQRQQRREVTLEQLGRYYQRLACLGVRARLSRHPRGWQLTFALNGREVCTGYGISQAEALFEKLCAD